MSCVSDHPQMCCTVYIATDYTLAGVMCMTDVMYGGGHICCPIPQLVGCIQWHVWYSSLPFNCFKCSSSLHVLQVHDTYVQV